MAVIQFENIKKTEPAEPLPERIDTGKATITNPALISKYLELEQKEKNSTGTVKESRQYYRLKKYGDSVLAKNKLIAEPKNRPSKEITLAQANKNPITPTQERFTQVIEDIFNGTEFITACKNNDIRPKDFYLWIDDKENEQEKQKFISARCCLAEYYLHRRESLEADLLAGRIDTSTYSTLANDYKYLAGKLHPAAYGEKIQMAAMIKTQTDAESINSAKIKELNALLQDGIIEAEYTEKSDS